MKKWLLACVVCAAGCGALFGQVCVWETEGGPFRAAALRQVPFDDVEKEIMALHESYPYFQYVAYGEEARVKERYEGIPCAYAVQERGRGGEYVEVLLYGDDGIEGCFVFFLDGREGHVSCSGTELSQIVRNVLFEWAFDANGMFDGARGER